MQEQFINKLRASLPDNLNLTDEIAAILEISYDAAYRRIHNKTNLSLQEAVCLAKHFKISLNRLFEVGSQNTLLAEKSLQIKDAAGLERYFEHSLESILPLTTIKGAEIIYSAKDIPIFYTLSDSYITKYKCYVWLKFLNEDGSMSKMPFEEFLKSAPPNLFKKANEVADTYQNINIVEFWNDNTINGTLQQVFYYFESGLLSKELAMLIVEDIRKIIHHVEEQTIQQTLINSKNESTYQLYKSDLLTMSNNMMVKARHGKMFFTPFTVLSYLRIEHPPTCEEMDKFFEKQKKNSKLLVNAGEKDRTLFFTKMVKKVNTIAERIHINQDLINF